MTPLRIGVLGAANITERAMVEPARQLDGVGVEAIGSRDPERARALADRLGIPAAGDYDALIDAPDLDLLYIALPPSEHARWATRALAAGKHVLCEKPLSANGATAAEIAAAADAAGRRAFVGFHYRLHPFIRELLEVLASDALGEVREVAIDFSIPHFVVKPGNIRLDGDLAGGAVMDVGCYAVDLLRASYGELAVESATSVIYDHDPRIDLQTDAQLRTADGVPVSIRSSFLGDDEGAMVLRVTGERAALEATKVIVPQWGAELRVTSGETVLRELAADPADNSYAAQLAHVAEVLRTGEPSILDAERAVGTMRTVDAIYRAAGLQPR
ncbi:MAG: Gfo/Idh/MocA family oxidoreductase [Actinomycetales bacterium]|nr:Gfo/Idh/MocA family oxidoreductase [Actinomycetales bacterium]